MDNKTTRTKLQRFGIHLKLLLHKNLVLSWRNKRASLFQLLTPIFVCLLLVLIQYLAENAVARTDPNPPVKLVGTVPPCKSGGSGRCSTMMFATSNNSNSWAVNSIMRIFAEQNHLDFDKDISFFDNNTGIVDYLSQNPNTTQSAVVFCNSQLTLPGGQELPVACEPPLYPYNLFYNDSLSDDPTLQPPTSTFTPDYISTATKVALDRAIMTFESQRTGKTVPTIEVSTQSFPQTANRRLIGVDVVSSEGAFWFFIPPMVSFVVVLSEIVREKEQRLRQGLSVMGMGSLVFWLSWLITSICYCVIVTLVLIASGAACGFTLFKNCNFLVLFLLFFTFGITMLVFAFWISTFIQRSKTAYTACYTFILLGLVLQLFLSNPLVAQFVYSEGLKDWIPVVRTFLSFYPPFNFAKAYGDVATRAAKVYDPESRIYKAGPGYSLSDMYRTRSGTLPFEKLPYFIPSTADTFMALFYISLALIALTAYFDNVISGNYGTSKPFYFIFLPRTWGFGKQKKVSPNSLTQSNTSINASNVPLARDAELSSNFKGDDSEDSDVIAERFKVVRGETVGGAAPAIRLEALTKRYSSGFNCGRRNKNDVLALKGIYLQVEQGELLAVLGHNGAGKSTMIGVITGLLPPTSGSASVAGYDVSTDMSALRQVMGVCPQHDILWGELTAREHLRMFAQLKNIPKNEIESEIDQKLTEVGLLDVGNALTGTFSGGMKRRLSVAISSIGDPRIIFMDEPTTGMDPQSRRQVWSLIQNLKKGRVIVLTTHSMEEADVLSDRICVMVDGRINCIGTALHLKNKFGEGYRVTLVSDADNFEEITSLVQTLLPSSSLLDHSAGSFVFSVPQTAIKEIVPFFKALEEDLSSMAVNKGKGTIAIKDYAFEESKEEEETRHKDARLLQVAAFDDPYARLKSLVADWGLSHTTLEDVFLKVTGHSNRRRSRLSSLNEHH
eukprot:GILK01008768.1.p1 GENE.GILK01008768.1~~GILK01008768.1.p1  ORF type:complete len:953 (+),score=144.68 GILK01008768.1:132-2990(+)